jgi:O-antigen/teichoic acid export membrane protein
MLANVLSRGASMLVMVLAVNLTIPYLGDERFGAWMTVASLAGLLMFLDLGIGNALTNRIAKINGEGNSRGVAKVISGGLVFLFLISLVVMMVLVFLAGILPWEKLVKVEDPTLWGELRRASISFSIIFAIGLFFGGVHRVFAGLQRAYEAHLATAVASIMSLALLWLGAEREFGIVPLLWVTLGCQQVSGVVLLARLWCQKLFSVKNGFLFMSSEKSLLIKVGGLFFVLQLAAIVYVGMDAILISSVLGAAHVAVYVVTQRLFQLVSIPLSIMNAPLWAAYADAYARGDGLFIVQTFKRSFIVTGVVALLLGGFFFVFNEQVIRLWTRGEVDVSFSLVGVFFLVMVVEALGYALSMVLNGCGVIREQVFFALIMVFLGVTLKICGLLLYGIEGMLWAWVLVYSFCVVFLYGFLWRRRILDVMTCSVAIAKG